MYVELMIGLNFFTSYSGSFLYDKYHPNRHYYVDSSPPEFVNLLLVHSLAIFQLQQIFQGLVPFRLTSFR